MQTAEAILSSAASMAVGFHEDTTPEVLKSKTGNKDALNLIACITKTGARDGAGLYRKGSQRGLEKCGSAGSADPLQLVSASADCTIGFSLQPETCHGCRRCCWPDRQVPSSVPHCGGLD